MSSNRCSRTGARHPWAVYVAARHPSNPGALVLRSGWQEGSWTGIALLFGARRSRLLAQAPVNGDAVRRAGAGERAEGASVPHVAHGRLLRS